MLDNRESPLILRYWAEVGGTLLPEYPLVQRSAGASMRRADAVIVVGGPDLIEAPSAFPPEALKSRDLIVVQAKARRLGMYLMGQAVFSQRLAERFQPNSVRSIVLVEKYDEILGPLLADFAGVSVEVRPPPHEPHLSPDLLALIRKSRPPQT